METREQIDGLRCLVISDFNAENFSALLSNNNDMPTVQAVTAPYGQVHAILLDAKHSCWQGGQDATIVWTQPKGVSESYCSLVEGAGADVTKLRGEVDKYCDLLAEAATRTAVLLVPLWVSPTYVRCYNLLEFQPSQGAGGAVLQMNAHLIERIARISNAYIMDATRWVGTVGEESFSDKMWYLAKSPFSTELYAQAVLGVKSALRGVRGDTRKLIVLDLDDTLWGGIVGDVGWKNLVLGGHDHIGEAYQDFQRCLKSFSKRGVLLAIVSKNDEALVLETLSRHPEMILQESDFAGWRINWADKAENLSDLLVELKLGVESVVFIDDSPVERARICETFPDVMVPDWPEDVTQYRRRLLMLDCFNIPSLSKEDSDRAAMYAAERERKVTRAHVNSLEEWLATLDIKIKVETLNAENLFRIAQLLNKTNQMNLCTRRMTEEEFMQWSNHKNREVLVFRVSDRFGDSGLTGIISLELEGAVLEVRDFVLSCRVMGRRIESSMLSLAADRARENGASKMVLRYEQTERNEPCLSFLRNTLSEREDTPGVFYWSVKDEFPTPSGITVESDKQT